jgi:hypothetical protein
VTRTKYVLAAALIVSLAGNLFLYREWSRQNAQVPYSQHFHGTLIDEAIKLYSAEIGVSPDEAMRNRFPVAMTVPDSASPGGQMRCVSLKLRHGMLGFTPVYCFHRDGDRARLKSQAKL